MIEFIAAFIGACVGTFAGAFGWHWYVVKKLDEEVKKMPMYLKSIILEEKYEL